MPPLCRVDQSCQVCALQSAARGQEIGQEEEEADTPVREGTGQWVTDKTRLSAFEACLSEIVFVFERTNKRHHRAIT
jgi:hypothetical protein